MFLGWLLFWPIIFLWLSLNFINLIKVFHTLFSNNFQILRQFLFNSSFHRAHSITMAHLTLLQWLRLLLLYLAGNVWLCQNKCWGIFRLLAISRFLRTKIYPFGFRVSISLFLWFIKFTKALRIFVFLKLELLNIILYKLLVILSTIKHNRLRVRVSLLIIKLFFSLLDVLFCFI